MITIRLGKKFTVKDFTNYINLYFIDSLTSNIVFFDLEELEWISLDGITFLFGWINNIKNIDHKCIVKLRLPNPSTLSTDDVMIFKGRQSKRRERRLISLVETWAIRHHCNIQLKDIVDPPNNLNSLLDKQFRNVYCSDSNWKKIIPFRKIDTNIYENIDNVRSNLTTELSEIFTFEEDVNTLLDRFSSQTPFKNKTLSHLITFELFLNTLHHAKRNEKSVNECYFSISLSNKFNEFDIQDELTKSKIEDFRKLHNCSSDIAENSIEPVSKELIKLELQTRIETRLSLRIESERSQITWPFFKDFSDKKYLNRSYLEFAFIDFGIGIPSTLRENYEINIQKETVKSRLCSNHFISKNIDSCILEYAFLLDSSRNPFSENIKIQEFVPRGLYFLLEIVRLYKGLLIVKSGTGEVMYDFSRTNIIKDSVTLSELNYVFPGTMLSIILPEQITSEIKMEPVQEIKKISERKAVREYVSIVDIYRKFQERYTSDEPFRSIDLYNHFFFEINNILDEAQSKNNHTLIYLDFAGSNLPYVDYKIFYFLVNTPKINKYTNFVLLNISNKALLKEVREGLMSFEPFIFRPIPCIIEEKEGINITWIGIKNLEEETLLNEILTYDNYALPASDFIEPELLIGNVIEVSWVNKNKKSANIQRSIFVPSIYDIEYVNVKLLNEKLKDRIIHPRENDEDILLKSEDCVFLTSGGYYQYEFLKFIDLLFNKDSNNRAFSEKIAISLFNTWRCKRGDIPQKIDWILTVTLSSQMLGRDVKNVYKRIMAKGEDDKYPKLLKLTHYYEFANEVGFELIKEGDKVLVVNDVISSGSLNECIYKSISLKKAEIVAFFSIVDCRIPDSDIDPEIEVRSVYNPKVDYLTISLVEKFPIRKYKTNIKESKNIIRINPIINAPTTMELQHSETIKIIYPNISDVLLKLNKEHLLIGYFINNKSYHTYFPNTENIFLKYSGKEFLRELIEKVIEIEYRRGEFEIEIGEVKTASELIVDYVFYPVFSGIEAFEDYHFQNYFKNKYLRAYPIPRIDTIKGWRFTFPPKILNKITKDKTVFILDDGSCSGETILQMIDSICFLDVKKIIVLSVFGRLEDFQREFFSRIKKMTVKRLKVSTQNEISKKEQIIDTHIYFGTQLNIHHFPFEKSTSFLNESKMLDVHSLKNGKKPKLVSEYINRRLKELQIIDVKDVDAKYINEKNHFHFPIKKDDGGLDVVRIYEIRNIIGRLDSYRIYKQYYDNTTFAETSDLELIIGIVNHEPYIIETIKHLLPELHEKLNSLINKIIFEDNIELSNRFYQWEIESLVMFLFTIDYPVLYDVKKMTKLFNILEIKENNEKALSYVTFLLWKETIGECKNGETVRATIFDIWYICYKSQHIKTKYYRLLTSLIDSFKYKEDISSIAVAFSNLHLFFSKEAAKPGHKQIEQNINNAIPALQDFSKDHIDILDIARTLESIKFYIKKNIDKLCEDDFLEKYLESIYNFLIGNEDSVYQVTNLIIKLFDELSELYTNEEKIPKITKNEVLRNKLADCLIDFNHRFIDVKESFALFCLNFYTDPIASWKKIVLNHKEILGYSNVCFNLEKLSDSFVLSFPIHCEALEKAYYNMLHNICNKALSVKVNIDYSIDRSNGIQFFSIEQDCQYDKDEIQIEGKGIDQIETIIRSFGGDVLTPCPNSGTNMYYHLIFSISDIKIN